MYIFIFLMCIFWSMYIFYMWFHCLHLRIFLHNKLYCNNKATKQLGQRLCFRRSRSNSRLSKHSKHFSNAFSNAFSKVFSNSVIVAYCFQATLSNVLMSLMFSLAAKQGFETLLSFSFLDCIKAKRIFFLCVPLSQDSIFRRRYCIVQGCRFLYDVFR